MSDSKRENLDEWEIEFGRALLEYMREEMKENGGKITEINGLRIRCPKLASSAEVQQIKGDSEP